MDFYAREVEQMDHARRASLEPNGVPRPPAAETEVEDHSSVREAKRARELSGEMPIPSADETMTNPEISAVASGVIPSISIPVQISPGASSSSGVKGVKRACNESAVSPNPSIVSSGSWLKRAHEKSPANDDEEQPRTRARISTLIAGLDGVDDAEDDEICNGDGGS